ncbi:MAG: tRNA (adenosine(37)-N6)-threonylcarbamoyltransferase complex dimerization subunit type 1 TsaB [Carbonactinosporaceae bacterium]
MFMLAFDTATPAVTVALLDGVGAAPGTPSGPSAGTPAGPSAGTPGGAAAVTVVETVSVDARRHGELLAPGIDRVLAGAGRSRRDLTDIAVGVGPGPFTGLRVGLVTAYALGDTLGVPVHGVCTLDVLAYAYGLDGPFAVATDARRREVYWASYTDFRSRTSGPAVDRPATVAARLAGLPVVGEGASIYRDCFPDAREPRLPSASALGRLAAERLAAGGAGLLPPQPLYLRRPDAAVPGARKQVTPA